MNTTDLALTPARKERLTDLAKLKAWQILLGIFFVFALFLPSLASPPVVYTFWSVACSVLLFRWWIVRTTARSLLSARFSGRSINFVCWRSIWSVAWKSFLILALLPCLAAAFVAPAPYYVATAIFAASTTWSVSLVFGADAAWGVARRMNPSASTSVMFGVVSLFSGLLAIPALIAGFAARKQLNKEANEEIGMQFARAGIGFAIAALVLNIAVISYYLLTGPAANSAEPRVAAPASPAAKTPTGPPPTGTAEDLYQRFKAHGQRSGDSRIPDIIEANFDLMKRLQDCGRDLNEANNQLDVGVIVDPSSTPAQSVAQQIEVLGSMQTAARALKDTAIAYREMAIAELSKTHAENPAMIAEALELSQPGMALTVKWADSSLAFSDVARRFLQTFQDTGEIEPVLFEAMVVRAEEYDATLDELEARSDRNRGLIQELLPR